MLRPRRTIDARATAARLDDLTAALRRQVDVHDPDPFDDAMVAAEAEGLAEAEAEAGKAARAIRRRER